MASSKSESKLQTIDLTKLNLMQLTQFKNQLDQDLSFYQESIQNLKLAQSKFQESSNALEKLEQKSSSSSKSILVPLTGSMYVPGHLKQSNRVLVDIGTGYYLEKDVVKGKEYFERKVKYVTEQIEKVGAVTYVQLFEDENGKARGCGLLEFETADLAKRAVEKMHRKEYKGRKLVVKEDFDLERDRYGKIIRSNSPRRERFDDHEQQRGRRQRAENRGGSVEGPNRFGNTYGLSPGFLESLGIDGPLHTRVFVANLMYSVDEKKLREVFRLAGRVVATEINRDKDGKSRGHGVVEFSHPVEAVQAISMLNDQSLFDRRLTVRFDKQPGPLPEDQDELPSRLPEGLAGVGFGLGTDGNPLTNVEKNLPSFQQQPMSPQLVQQQQQPAHMQHQQGMQQTLQQGNANNLLGNLGNLNQLASQVGIAALAKLIGGGSGGGAGATGGGGNGGGMAGSGMTDSLMSATMPSVPPTGGPGGPAGPSGPPMAAPAGLGPMADGPQGGGGPINPMASGPGGQGGGYSSSAPTPTASSSMGGYSSGMAMRPPMNESRGPGLSGLSSGAMGNAGNATAMASDTILIRNLPPECTWQSLREGFSHCGEIKYAEIKERGTGMVRFASIREAERAVSMMDKQIISNRTIDVRVY